MYHTFITCFFALLGALSLSAQSGHEIRVQIDGFDQPELYLAYYLGDKQYIQDTAARAADGAYVFSGPETLPGGMYLVVMPPDNNFFQLLIDPNSQRFEVRSTAAGDQVKETRFVGSADNTLFYRYLNFLGEQRPKAEALAAAKEAEPSLSEKDRIQAQLDALNQDVIDYQRKLVANHPETMTALIIRANQTLETPEFAGTDEETQFARWQWTRQHYFDNLDLGDPRALRTPFFFQRVDYYVQKLNVQHPDTINLALDEVLRRMQPAPETFKFYLVHFLNFYAQSKFVGMDGVYVHLVDNYYAQGMAPWVNEEQLTKIVSNANTLRPLLIGRIAPDIKLQTPDGQPTSLHGVDSEFTILYFWRYDCGHCKETTPLMREFYQNFKDRGVKIFAICTKTGEEVAPCWEYTRDNEIGDWMHAVDPYMRSRYNSTYDVRSTPQIYVLDRDKRIVSKRIGAEQLEELMNQLLEEQAMQRQTEQLERN